jgi:3-(3-hydroxy-phenyl)propionate hydroxylase
MRFLVPGTEEEARRRLDVLERAATDPEARAQVDSGRLAEPFWYVDSPLTTADPHRPFAGRPPRGAVPPPAPGTLCPDAPVPPASGTGSGRRFRELARDGFLLLAADGVDGEAVRAAAARAAGPTRVLALPEIDQDGALTTALDARPGEVWIIRPDAHIAAVLAAPDSSDITAALDRAVANTEGEPRWRTTGDPVRSRRNGTPSTAVPTAGSTTRS